MDGDEHGDAPFLDDDWDVPGEHVPPSGRSVQMIVTVISLS
jgi:hypothetical protein